MALLATLGLRPTARSAGAPTGLPLDPAAAAGELRLGAAQIVEMSLGEAVPGPRLGTLMALLAADGSRALDRSNSAVGGQLNRDGVALQRSFAALGAIERRWRARYGAVQALATQSALDLRRMQQQRGAVGGRSRDRRGAYVRDRSEAYLQAEARVRDAVREFGVRENALRKAVSLLDEANLRREVVAQGRAVEQARVDVEAEKKRIEVMKNRLKGALGIALKVVKQDWKALAEEAARFLGGQLIDEISTARLAELKQQLEQAGARLHALEDQAMLQAIATASAGLEEAAGALDDGGQDIREALKALALARKTAVEALGESGPTRGAARMIERRGQMMQLMAATREAIGQYLAEAPAVGAAILRIDAMAAGYPDLVWQTPGADPDHARALAATVARNREALALWSMWVRDEENSCRTALGLLDRRGAGSFVEHFDRVDELLQDALEAR